MLRLITDFDGPVMDVSERYYQVYLYCLEQVRRSQQSIQTLSKEKFWALKRAKVPERQIGFLSGLDAGQADRFVKLRRQNVHSLPYLHHDRLLPQAKANLQFLQQQGIDLVVMTMRRTRELNAAFEKYDLEAFFPENRRYCLADGYIKTTDVEDKPKLMARALAELPAAGETWMVGDTEADIIAAQRHQIPVIAVLSGIRDRERLLAYSPDRIADSLEAAIDLILQKSAVLS
jgi:phosphoglycolate phosphatase-like HAD superfamily hydrolase